MRFIVNDIPPSINKVLRMHWAKRFRLKDAWRLMIRAGFGNHPKPRPVRQKVKITLWHSRAFDKDNAYGACKVVFDAMKAEGLIVDDSSDWLDASVEQAKCSHKERHTIIEMEDRCET